MKSIKIFIASTLCILPIVYILMISLSTNYTYPSLLPAGITFKKYSTLFATTEGMGTSFLTSILIASIVALLATVIGFLSSRAIANSKYHKQWLFCCYFPIALSPVVFAATFHFYFIYVDIAGTLVGVILAQLFIAIPYSILLLSSFWSNQIMAIEQTSYTLGANFKNTFFKVLLPIAKPTLLICFFQVFLLSWFDYGVTSFIGVGKVPTLTIKVFQYINEANIYYAALGSCVIVLPVIILLWVNKRFVFSKIN
ncbi:ABC transporter permease [Ferruginibacter yonginensis]|uniref:ABC transporter permease n=1 Tax=Ferruginibacter yonginensis TaxID=1310416 RepID=A0ABV8QVC1_9BACT